MCNACDHVLAHNGILRLVLPPTSLLLPKAPELDGLVVCTGEDAGAAGRVGDAAHHPVVTLPTGLAFPRNNN